MVTTQGFFPLPLGEGRVRDRSKPHLLQYMTLGARLIGVLFALSLVGGLAAQQPVPSLNRRVTDLTGTLNPSQQADLETTLHRFEQKKGSQVSVLIVPTTQPETIEQYSIRVAEQWKLGRKGVDDGVLLLIAKNDRTLRIEVGYGLEGVLPDALCNRIIDEHIVPRFRAGDFYGGIQAGVARLVSVIDGEPLPAPKQKGNADIILIIVFVLFVAASFFSRLLGGSSHYRRGGFYRSGGWGGGGGGFGGGGGGFGGGGASGRW
jgi:uncharacterized protein